MSVVKPDIEKFIKVIEKKLSDEKITPFNRKALRRRVGSRISKLREAIENTLMPKVSNNLF